MSQEREVAIGFMLEFSENPDKILDSIVLRDIGFDPQQGLYTFQS